MLKRTSPIDKLPFRLFKKKDCVTIPDCQQFAVGRSTSEHGARLTKTFVECLFPQLFRDLLRIAEFRAGVSLINRVVVIQQPPVQDGHCVRGVRLWLSLVGLERFKY